MANRASPRCPQHPQALSERAALWRWRCCECGLIFEGKPPALSVVLEYNPRCTNCHETFSNHTQGRCLYAPAFYQPMSQDLRGLLLDHGCVCYKAACERYSAQVAKWILETYA